MQKLISFSFGVDSSPDCFETKVSFRSFSLTVKDCRETNKATLRLSRSIQDDVEVNGRKKIPFTPSVDTDVLKGEKSSTLSDDRNRNLVASVLRKSVRGVVAEVHHVGPMRRQDESIPFGCLTEFSFFHGIALRRHDHVERDRGQRRKRRLFDQLNRRIVGSGNLIRRTKRRRGENEIHRSSNTSIRRRLLHHHGRRHRNFHSRLIVSGDVIEQREESAFATQRKVRLQRHFVRVLSPELSMVLPNFVSILPGN